MLVKLTVSDFALLRDTKITLRPGFTAVTGETGAGKSLLVGAVAFLAGGRTTMGVVRDGAQRAVVEGEFSVGGDEIVILRRELSAEGRTRAFISDSPVSLKQLAKRAASLVDITAQRSFSHLLDFSRHLDFLDHFTGLEVDRARLREFETDYSSLARRIRKLELQHEEFRQRSELVAFQLTEIDSVDPQPGEDDRLAAEIHRLEHFEELHQSSARLEELLVEGEPAVEPLLAEAAPLLEWLAKIDPELADLTGELDTARTALREIARRVAERCRSVGYEADRLETLRERQHRLAGLARKFGGSLTALLERRREMQREMTAGDRTKGGLSKLRSDRQGLVSRWCKLALRVGKLRRRSASRLEAGVVNSLTKLGVKDGRFEVRFSRTPDPEGLFEAEGQRWRLDGRGAEAVEFFLSTNPGIEPRPLAQVASGGELSRLLLALKEALPVTDNEVTVFFDEIDTGVSGRVARLVGLKLKELACGRQMVVITHLPQIAGLADRHLRVSKRPGEWGMESEIREIKGEQRIRELASLLSDGAITGAALEQARRLTRPSKSEQ